MAEVDFSNARIEPTTALKNPTYAANLGLDNNPVNSSGSSITGGASYTRLINEPKQLTYLYQGTFTASGTEFYIRYATGEGTYTRWRIYNISFSSGDTYVFTINATLTCN